MSLMLMTILAKKMLEKLSYLERQLFKLAKKITLKTNSKRESLNPKYQTGSLNFDISIGNKFRKITFF